MLWSLQRQRRTLPGHRAGPRQGIPNLPTLDLLGEYRRDLETTEPLPFGIYGEVLEPGPVTVGDPVAVED